MIQNELHLCDLIVEELRLLSELIIMAESAGLTSIVDKAEQAMEKLKRLDAAVKEHDAVEPDISLRVVTCLDGSKE